MKKVNYLSSAEYAIMTILWNAEKPISSSEILENRIENTWSANSFHPLINNLVEKGFVRIEGSIMRTKAVSRLYCANVSLSEYTAMQINNAFQNESKKPFDLPAFLSLFIGDNQKRKNDIVSDLERWLEDKKENK